MIGNLEPSQKSILFCGSDGSVRCQTNFKESQMSVMSHGGWHPCELALQSQPVNNILGEPRKDHAVTETCHVGAWPQGLGLRMAFWLALDFVSAMGSFQPLSIRCRRSIISASSRWSGFEY